MPALPETEGQVSNPLIICLCLTRDRPDFLARALRCFNAQTYSPKAFAVIDSTGMVGVTTGGLRNQAIEQALNGWPNAEYIAHWDFDDWYHPHRLEAQYNLIQFSGKLVAGFYEQPMYDTRKDETWIYSHEDKRYSTGNALFYHREAWERIKFPDKTPEDTIWQRHIGFDNRLSMSGMCSDGTTPLIIQTIHGSNASAQIIPSSSRFSRATAAQHAAVKEILRNA